MKIKCLLSTSLMLLAVILASPAAGGDPPGVLAISPAELDFGVLPANVTATQSLQVSNAAEPGAASLTVSALNLGGDAAFTLTGGTCETDMTLAVDESCTVEITFSPDDIGEFVGEFVVDAVEGQQAAANLLGAANQIKLTASDGGEFHQFGIAMAISGDTALVSRGDPISGPDSASRVYILTHDGNQWLAQGTLFPDDHPVACAGVNQCPFFGHSVAIDGDTAVVGAPSEQNDNEPGAAYVFVRSGETWTQQAKLLPGVGGPSDQFGLSVAISGNTILVGAPGAEVADTLNQGLVHVFVYENEDWVEQAQLMPADDYPVPACSAAVCPRFGNAVDLMGDTALVGAENMQINGNNRRGAAFVFTRDGATWSEQARLETADGGQVHLLGAAVALSDGAALVGAPTVPGVVNNQGAAYVFTQFEGVWTEHSKLVPSDAASVGAARFGSAVDWSNGVALIGAPDARVNGVGQGAAYLYGLVDGAWSEQDKLSALDGAASDRFGHAVALGNGTALAGAPWAAIDGNGFQGAAYVVLLPEPELEFAPAGLDFGDIEVGDTSSSQSAVLSNTGEVVASGLNFGAPGSGFSVNAEDCGQNLPAGDSCSISISFAPTEAGEANAVLTVSSDQGAAADLALTGNGVGSEADLRILPSSLNFGVVEVGQTGGPLSTTLSNAGETNATGLIYTPPGDGFVADLADCGSTLPAGQSCQISVTFTPGAEGPVSAMLAVAGDNEAAANLNLAGHGQLPGVLAVAPGELDFGEVVIGNSRLRILTVSNSAEAGAADIELASLEITGGAPAFALTGGTCMVGTVLAAGDDCTVQVTFQPDSTEIFSGQVTVTSSDGQTVAVGRPRQ